MRCRRVCVRGLHTAFALGAKHVQSSAREGRSYQ